MPKIVKPKPIKGLKKLVRNDGPPPTVRCVRKGCPSVFVKATKPAFDGYCSARCKEGK